MSKDLEKFTTTSLRGQKRGIYEHSQGSLLMKGIQTEDKLTKIFTICEGALLSENKDKLDLEKVTTCSDVCLSFQNTTITKMKNFQYVNVAWIFRHTEENYNRYVKPWYRVPLRYYPLMTNYRQTRYPETRKMVSVSPWDELAHYNKRVEFEDQLRKQIEDDLSACPDDLRFFLESSALSIRSFNILQGEFTSWALKELSDTRRELTKEISPKTWKDLTSGREEEEEEDLE